MVKMMVVEDDSASSVKGGGVFLSFRSVRVESSVVFEETTRKLQQYNSNLRPGGDQDRVVSRVDEMEPKSSLKSYLVVQKDHWNFLNRSFNACPPETRSLFLLVPHCDTTNDQRPR